MTLVEAQDLYEAELAYLVEIIIKLRDVAATLEQLDLSG